MRDVYRIQPLGPAGAYKTYALITPSATHFRPAPCGDADVDCLNYTNGWKTIVPTNSDAALYIRTQSGRRFEEYVDGDIVTFVFDAGQQCFAQHEVPLEREPIAIVKGGDWRGNPTGAPTRRHSRVQDWVEDFAEHQQHLAERYGNG